MRRFYSRETIAHMPATTSPQDKHLSPHRTLDRALVWLRRDLRAYDHAALHQALRSARQVWCVFVFDTELLAPLPRADRRVEFIRESLVGLDGDLRRLGQARGVTGAGLVVCHGITSSEIPRLAATLGVQAVYASHDDDPYALARDAKVRGVLADQGVAFHTTKDHVIFERSEVLTGGGTPYGVFTPYKNAWLKRLSEVHVQAWEVGALADALGPVPLGMVGVPTLASLGFESTNLAALPIPTGTLGGLSLLEDFLLERIDAYDRTRDFPSVKGPSYLSTHLRFGTVSIRHLVREAWGRARAGSRGAEVWLSELIWRDFYHQVLHHHPHVVGRAFRQEYDRIHWEQGKHAQALFKAWCAGQTGYPLVDAAMLQLNQTGYMHNRLRMVVASFLTKDLGLDWRWGERYFTDMLNDFDLAANNGGWQWASSSGCDAQPWFRIFNPTTQSEKFDPQGRFIRRYLPQLSKLPDKVLHAPWTAGPLALEAAGVVLGRNYPLPVVHHDEARQRTLARYGVVKKPEAR